METLNYFAVGTPLYFVCFATGKITHAPVSSVNFQSSSTSPQNLVYVLAGEDHPSDTCFEDLDDLISFLETNIM